MIREEKEFHMKKPINDEPDFAKILPPMKHLNKVRAMTGVGPNRGSAGRSNAVTRVEAVGGFFMDVGRACEVWLRAHDPEWTKYRDHMSNVERAKRDARKRAAEGRTA